MSDTNVDQPQPTTAAKRRKDRIFPARPLLPAVESKSVIPKPDSPPAPPPPVIDEKLGPKDGAIEIIVKVHNRHQALVTATFPTLLPELHNHAQRWVSLQAIDQLFEAARQAVKVKLNDALGPDPVKPSKKKSDGEDTLKNQMPAPFPASKMPGDLSIHTNPDIGGVESKN